MVVAPLGLKSRFSTQITILSRLSLMQFTAGYNHMVVAVPYTFKVSAVYFLWSGALSSSAYAAATRKLAVVY